MATVAVNNLGMKTIVFGMLVLMLTSCTTTQIFYIVRHAEKQDNSEDPPLSEAGIARGIALEKYMADKKLDTVFTSLYKRAALTGLSVSFPQSLPHIQLKQWPQTDLNDFIKRLKKISGNRNLLIVGHTNTIPPMVQALSGQSIAAIPEDVYNIIYTITISGTGKTLVSTTYGR
jgi:phosphohistidine phosphatase SixA